MSNQNKNTILISGACGFVGKGLVKWLLSNSNARLILNCRNVDIRIDGDNRVIYTDGDLTKPETFRKYFEQFQPYTVIHLGGVTRLSDGENNPDLAWQTNYQGTRMLLQFAKEFESKTFLFISSDLARNANGVIGLTKYLAESLIRDRNFGPLEVFGLRLPNVAFTPGSVHTIFEQQISENKDLSITHKDMSRRFITLDEAIEYIIEVVNNGKSGKVYVIDKPVQKIMALASDMIASSKKKLQVKIIGIKPGEKLVEESYHQNEIEHTGFRNLAFLKNDGFDDSIIQAALHKFNAKPLLKNKIDLTSL